MIALNILLSIVAFVLLLGLIAEVMPSKQKNLTAAFIAVLAFIAILNIIT